MAHPDSPAESPRCLIVAPHPDDETIGAAIWMSRHGSANLTLAHVTDGSPANVQAARDAGFASPDEYARARREELYAAMNLINIHQGQCIRLGFVDQNVHEHLPELIRELVRLMREVRPQIVLTPSYEGGHPDHDSTAFAMSEAKRSYAEHVRHLEYRLYHAGANGDWETEDFLPHDGTAPKTLALTSQELRLKAAMAAEFRSQAGVLARFRLADECFRAAPLYDFTQPPHRGGLLYEKFGWGISWNDWRLAVITIGRGGIG